MASPVMHITVSAFAVGCAACGTSVEVPVAEARLLGYGLFVGEHVGPLVSAALMSVEGSKGFWAGDPDLMLARGYV